ncbi:MAG: SDR family NAD(P)-dependent oxidoreductase [Desulfobacterales bacterium]|nr:SDR family NAD(P)-dependent oxidoreductase [Desulfobacterales bacterium]
MTPGPRIYKETDGQPIAIIGMGCIFPESRNLKEYWHLLFNGIDAIRPIPEKTHWQLKDYYDSNPSSPDRTYCERGGFIPDIAFDPLSYGIPPNNLGATDTSQLLGLEVARMALEDAGYPVGHTDLQNRKVNVVLGVTGTQELVIPLGARLGHPLWKKALEDAQLDPEKRDEILARISSSYVQWQENSFPGLLGNVVAGRIANRLNLSGTNCVSDAACASSLSAIHTAIMELETGRCDMSITGGVDTLNDIFMHMCFSKTGVLSHTSDAKPFSKDADGTVLGEGIGMLVLKRLSDAERDNDRIYAVIKGVGTASDGKTSAIYAPESKGQLKALKAAYEKAGVDPATVSLIEAHGTGTRVGDKVEFTALKELFKDARRTNTTAIGSVKSMIGHTKAAAGAAGIIKTALSLHHKVIPPTLKANTPDPELDINSSAFYLNNNAKPWVPKTDAVSPRRSGISAFGFGGSNFHAVLEEYTPQKDHVSWDGSAQIIAVSAKDKMQLTDKLKNIADTVLSYDTNDQAAFTQAIAWQAFESRKTFDPTDVCRVLVLIDRSNDFSSMMEKAQKVVEGDLVSDSQVFFGTGKPSGKLGFVFPGQGSQYTGMAKDIIAMFPEAMEALTLAQDTMQKGADGKDNPALSEFIFPLPEHVQDKKQAEAKLRDTRIAQPAIGAVSLAMTRILKRFNITSQMTCGHSFGELSALYGAGWLKEEDFLTLAAARGQHMADAGKQSGDAGTMLAVKAPIEKIQELIDDSGLNLVLANKNSPTQGVLSGSTDEIDKAAALCKEKKMRAVKLPVAAAFHSHLVERAATPFKADVDKTVLNTGKIPVMSNTTGTSYPHDPEHIKKVLGHQLMHPVNFIENIEYMNENGVTTFVEVGPKSVLSGLIKSILKGKNIHTCSVDQAAGKSKGILDLAKVLCTLAAQGHSLDLTAWEDAAVKPVPKRMTIMLNGANPKPAPVDIPLAKKKESHTVEKQSQAKQTAHYIEEVSQKDQFEKQGTTMTPSPDTQPRQPKHTMQPQPTPGNNTQPTGNVALLQKGLETMQQLQAQTARAHEKFLETQAQASQTLAEMMAQTRGSVSIQSNAVPQYTQPSVSTEPVQTPVETQVPAQNKTVSHETTWEQPQPEITSQPVPQNDIDHPTAASSAPSINEEPSSAAKKDIQPILFETVSRLTGFPVEMLEPEMDIESDLGIDSIKKVEIISELEKAIPDGSNLSTEHLSSVRTLDDICRAMEETQAGSQTIAASPQTKESSQVNEPAVKQDSAKNGHDISAVLVSIISELTGFPKEMLEPEMNLESDLGIDSIKRVEILSRMEQELPDMKALSPDDMGSLKTIQDIVQFLIPEEQTVSSETGKKKTSHEDLTSDSLPLQAPENNTDLPAPQGPLLRQTVSLTSYPTNQVRFYNGARIQISSNKTVYLTRDAAGVAEAFQNEFKQQGIKAELIDLSSTDTPELPDAAGLVIIPDAHEAPDDETAQSFLLNAFCLAKSNAGHLENAAKETGAFMACLSFSGGSFGFENISQNVSPVYGGLAGLAKTADLEWKNVLCRALDLPADINEVFSNSEAAVSLMMTHGAVEMGLNGEKCIIPALTPSQINQEPLQMDSDDVVVITGGAKGVTAECALAIAKACSPKIILLGRSPAPFSEPDWIKEINDPAEMKRAILTHGFDGKKPTPVQVETEFKKIISNRSIQNNIDRIAAWSSQVQYHSVDIRNNDQINEVLSKVTKDLGPVTAVIHGAGVLEDKLIAEKTPDQFSRVFKTKVKGLHALLDAVNEEHLKYLVLFSSIAARMGNPGQCDYAMANEVLNKTAQAKAQANANYRVISVNWGPWDGGMVTPELKREFSRRGVTLIPLAQGADQLITEMGNPDPECVEVVIGGTMNPSSPRKEPVLNKALKQTLGVASSPIINDHKINHEPVVPFAMMVDLMACAAEKNNPGLHFAGIDGMRLLKGISPGDKEVDVHINLGKCIPKDSFFTSPSTLTSQSDHESHLIHAQGDVILENRLSSPPVLSQAAFMDLKPYGISVEEAYEQILFHTGDLRRITEIKGVSEKGIEVTATPAQSLQKWYRSPHSKTWTIDPMLLDAAFQAAILWTHHSRQEVCLPSFFANLRIYASYPEQKGNIRILFTVNEQTQHKIQGYFTFLDETDTVIASIMGFEAFIDSGLKNKFKPEPLFNKERILAFAQGNPSQAFGEPYKIFDEKREIARLPRPPYFFMDAVMKADHSPWEMAPGGWIESTYEIPEHEWYFEANRTSAMPFCILLEIALQPCGWLAAYAGSALKSEDRLHFRNLGGKATLLKNPTNKFGKLTIRARMTDVSQAGGMIIQDFDMEVLCGGEMVYQGTTNFGFFTSEALANQVGIRSSSRYKVLSDNSREPVKTFTADAPITPEDTLTSPNTGMPAKSLMMIDAVTHMEFEGGLYDRGLIQGIKQVDDAEWFFDAHFYQDPVCPGSLGVESFLQLLRFFLIKKYDINPEKYQPVITENQPHGWIYRGQIIPDNKTIIVQAHIKQIQELEDGTYSIIADGALCVDGICIYEMEEFGLQFVPEKSRAPKGAETAAHRIS